MHKAPAALLFLAACSHVPREYPTCRLVGTWAHITRKGPGRLEPPHELVREANAQLAWSGYSVTESFLANGIWVARGDSPAEQQFGWTLLSDNDDHITVRIDFPPEKGGQMLRTLAFESPDLLLDTRGAYTGVRLARVPDPK
jgi:hypothetical protein